MANDDEDTTPDLDKAFREIRRWYYHGIRQLVDGLISDLKDEKPEDEDAAREWLTERVDEDTDGHEFVIYTFKAKCLLLASDNEDAYQDELGEPAPTVEAAACMAMRRDAWELLDARSDEWIPSEPDEVIDPEDGPDEVHKILTENGDL